jgi:aminobenzoyl-glutamate utilization protein B
MSQVVAPHREPLQEGAPGHACGHSALGAAAVGAAIAIKEALQKHRIPGTIRLYGTPAEETVIGKVYMALDGQFDDLDICLHWHPSDKNAAWSASSKALVSAKFTFEGLPAHASVSPEAGRSALDAVELMNVGANYLREHIREDARIHYVITNGGGQPNVVPARATVWYYVRADKHQDVEYLFDWLRDIAQGAALMTRTRVTVQIDTDCHEIIPNRPLAELLTRNLRRVGPPTFTEEERTFARRLQEPLEKEFGWQFSEPLETTVREEQESELSKGSTDVGDISWRVPTGGLRTACFVAGAPGHSWQNVATIASSIGEKGMLYAAKTLAVSALDLFEDSRWIAAARDDWKQRMQGRTYRSLIPPGQRPPKTIR